METLSTSIDSASSEYKENSDHQRALTSELKARARQADQVRAFAASRFQSRFRFSGGEGDDVHRDIMAQNLTF